MFGDWWVWLCEEGGEGDVEGEGEAEGGGMRETVHSADVERAKGGGEHSESWTLPENFRNHFLRKLITTQKCEILLHFK